MRCVVLVLALAACGEDPSLRVKVDFERPPIDRIVVSVYESPTITCEQIEYADLDEAQLSALLVAEQSIDGDGTEGALEGMSRTDHKLIVARGYSQTGELLEGGCEAHDLVVENDSVLVKTHVIAAVSAEVVVGENTMLPVDPFRITVLATDRDGVPLEDRPVAWRMVGPAGSDEIQSTNVLATGDGTWQPENPACTGPNGATPIHPVTPNLVGGFAVSVRAAWANQTQTLFSGVTNTDFALTDIDIPAETKHPCAVSIKRINGALAKRLVCVDGAFAREYPVTLANGVTTLGTPVSASLGRPPIGLYALPASDPSLRDVFALDKDGAVTALFGATGASATLNCPECADHVVDALIAPACGQRDPAKMVMVVRPASGPDKIKVMPARGGIAVDVGVVTGSEPNLEITINNAGCVSALGANGYEDRQLTVLDLVTSIGSFTRGFYNCAGTCKRVVLPVAESAVGFTMKSPPYLIGATSDATGIVLATWGLVPDPDDPMTDRLVERAGRVATGALPRRLAIGTYDEDDGSDMIWDIPARGRNGTTFELAYTSSIGVRLQALSAPLALAVIDVLSTDVTQDDHDDIIIVARKALTNQGGVVVVPTHAVAPAKSIPVTTCGS